MFGPGLTFIGGVSGTAVTFLIMKAIEKRWKSEALAYVGRTTMTTYLWHMLILTAISILLITVTGVGVAQDIWYMAIIPKDQIALVTISIVLTLLCCLGLVKLKERVSLAMKRDTKARQ